MAATKDQILESISNMTVMEVVELISEMEEKFGVTAAAPVAAAAPAAGGDAASAAAEKPSFDVALATAGTNKRCPVESFPFESSQQAGERIVHVPIRADSSPIRHLAYYDNRRQCRRSRKADECHHLRD